MTKKIILIIVINILILSLGTICFASSLTQDIKIGDGQKEFEGIGNKLLGVVQVVGILSSVAALMIVGIKYMLSSVEEKSEYKKTFYVYMVGALMVFGISTFIEIIYNYVK